ncbi:MAG: Stp1/IreP family PP2C-type Ser/Thr phosphatase [Lawsonibacter sp.]|jgi:serine/threonine protein phosphatase PrpC|uniref:Stp1/IreP family PP2C-type Ser/Thr phosphatase n=1 Tax=Lawsonibacter sp. JLR.KK007 TaxID=3114293 RepID=UPI00216C2CE6|nr:Stp1/IreP family PP2C-type Ser/Thr phosphatase [Lawsonibacter sp.]MCI8989784.1 Stp1/IreP family PP2C-type Ser/Thr phosphatase [Lawsonibacter sp.]MCI9268558.1 Stp1/IreP family PP2C-type Ser/Thr phosphatase [Lawsonibacter sp.]
MQVWGVTDRGAVRQQNQDAYAARVLEDGRVIALVCDGMGGARAGNVASTMAVERFMEEFFKPGQDGPVEERIGHAASVANQEIFARSIHDEACTGMGTTLVAVLAGEREAVILNEGDSRCYHINAEGIILVTRDHSLVEDLVERGELTREQARTHPHKNLITRALGAEPVLMADCFRQALEEGDYLLLCSDGLSNVVNEQEMLYEVIHGGEDGQCCQRLLDIALSRGAPDNVTAVLVKR